jgi:hypothetical protein
MTKNASLNRLNNRKPLLQEVLSVHIFHEVQDGKEKYPKRWQEQSLPTGTAC